MKKMSLLLILISSTLLSCKKEQSPLVGSNAVSVATTTHEFLIPPSLPDTGKVSVETPYNRKCEELGGEANMISCHQTTATYQDDKYNLMITELEAACLETNNGDTRSFVVSDVWSFETNNYDVRSYCFCFDQDI